MDDTTPDTEFFTAEGFLRWLATVLIALVSLAVLGLSLIVAAGWRP